MQLEDDHPVFICPYRLSLFRQRWDQIEMQRLLDAKFVEHLDRKYACAIVISSKIDVLRNWMEKCMCKNYLPVNRKTKFD